MKPSSKDDLIEGAIIAQILQVSYLFIHELQCRTVSHDTSLYNLNLSTDC